MAQSSWHKACIGAGWKSLFAKNYPHKVTFCKGYLLTLLVSNSFILEIGLLQVSANRLMYVL